MYKYGILTNSINSNMCWKVETAMTWLSSQCNDPVMKGLSYLTVGHVLVPPRGVVKLALFRDVITKANQVRWSRHLDQSGLAWTEASRSK